MTYVWLTWLPDALIAAGCTVKTEDGWKNRGRPASAGGFDPYAVGLHHTATHASYDNPHPTLRMCIDGRSDLPGPLCHVLICYDGTCHVIAAGRANHAGESNGNGPLHAGDGNAQLVGFEIDYDGSQEMSREQYDAAVKASAGVLARFNRSADYCRGHKEWSTTGKWDPGGYNMNAVRGDVADQLAGGGDDMPKYLSLSGPGFNLPDGGDWHAVKMTEEHSDAGDRHSGDYAWLGLSDCYYQGQARLDVDGRDPGDVTIVARWAEYDTDTGNYVSAPTPVELPLTSGGTGVYVEMTDVCSKGHRVRLEVKARGGGVAVGSAGIACLYWPK